MNDDPILTITRPDDWHLHLRDDAALKAVLPFSARRFGRALIMPNLQPPITSVVQALAYRDRILAAVPLAYEERFRPLMSLFLTAQLNATEIGMAATIAEIVGVKLYPAGATTNSSAGVRTLEGIYPQLEQLEKRDLPLLVHGESGDPEIDIFDREACFIDQHLAQIVEKFPALRVVLEHITTREGVDFVRQSPARVAGTITAHHLLLNRNHLLAGGIRPHHYCLPVVKRESHRLALLAAATSGDSSFFLGTDSAPHAKSAKEAACGCAGIFTAHAGIELYAEAFAAVGALDKLEGFASLYGAAFYGLEPNRETISLRASAWTPDAEIAFGDERLVPFRGGEAIAWSLVG